MAGKLGRLAPTPSRPRLRLRDYLVAVPDHPIADPASPLDFPMDLNDRVGCCVVAAWDHCAQRIKTTLAGSYTNMTDAQIVADYMTQNPHFDINGKPDAGGNLPGDGGMVIQLYLEYLRKSGRILGFAHVDHTVDAEVQAAIYLFLAIITGETLTQANLDQFDNGQPWDYDAGPAVGGHATSTDDYSTPVLDDAITWAKRTTVTNAFMVGSVEELWVPILPEHVAHPGWRARIDGPKLAADFQALTGEPFPSSVPPIPVVPPAPPINPDATLAAIARPWVAEHHVGMNHTMQRALQRWLQQKGLA